MTFLPFDIRTLIKPETGGTIEVDVTPTQQHDLNNIMTEFELEDGSKANDHITELPNRVELDLTFSDTPISKFDPTVQFQSAEGRSRTLFRQIQDLKRNKVKCLLVTGLQAYNDMYIEKLGVPRRSGDGKKVSCVTTFRQLIFLTRAGTGLQGLATETTFDVSHTVRGLISLGDIG